MAAPLRVLSLCSGIGGLDLGVCRALGGRVVAYCERDPYAAAVLLERMEDSSLVSAPVWVGDLREMDAQPLAGHVDVLCGGYPCQPFSQAGKRLGNKDPRHLWPEFARIIREVRPRFVCLENVAGHLRLGLDRVLGDLAELGFDAEWSTLRASDVGAPHLRRRVFVLGWHANCINEGAVRHFSSGSRAQPGRDGDASNSDRKPGREQPISVKGCGDKAQPGSDGTQGPLADAKCYEHKGPPHEGGGRQWPEKSTFIRDNWATEPDVGRVADGVPARVDRLRCLGNAVVPQQAEAAFQELLVRMTDQA